MGTPDKQADDAEELWQALCARMVHEHPGEVEPGRMMSASALTHGGKVFCFHSTKGGIVGLGCRLGRDYPVESLGLSDWRHLAPFRSKPPMKDWIVAGIGDCGQWERLANAALEIAKRNRKNVK